MKTLEIVKSAGKTDRAIKPNSAKTSVGAHLRRAFVGISLFSLLSAIVGLITYHLIEQAQNDVFERDLPALQNAQQLAQQGLSIIVTSPNIVDTLDPDSLTSEVTRINEAAYNVEPLIDSLRELGMPAGELDAIRDDARRILINLRKEIDLIVVRQRISSQINDDVVWAKHHAKQISTYLRPAILSVSASLSERSEKIRSVWLEEGAEGATRNALEMFEDLIDVDFLTFERLSNMHVRSEKLHEHIFNIVRINEHSAITALKDSAETEVRNLVRDLPYVADTELRGSVVNALEEIVETVQGAKSIYAQKYRVLSINDELDQLAKETKQFAGNLEHRVNLLLAQVNSDIENSKTAAQQAVTIGRLALISIALIALAAALYVTWRYVLQGVVARLTRLTEITREVAAGNSDVIVDVTGNDELTDMAAAVEVFKTNASELRRSNSELEKFAYAASHDLKAPLRGIANLARWIESELEGKMEEETQSHITLLKGRVRRLESLLDDLLQYSRAGRQRDDLRDIDLHQVMPELVKLVDPGNLFELNIVGTLPKLRTALAPLEQVFRNLIANAVKHHDLEQGQITIWYNDLGDRYEFFICDDGPGIPAQFHERIFAMFQTLRPRDDVESSGMGLAIIKKIVDTLGGEISVDSDPDSRRGTTFRFTWPKEWPLAMTTANAA